MKIYFAFSIRGAKRDENLIKELYEFLTKKGYIVTTEFNIIPKYSENIFSDRDIFERDIKALESSDILIADVSSPSLGVGYEIAYAICKNIKVIAFVKEGVNLSAMINGNPEISLIRYNNLDDLKNKLNKFF